MNDSYVLLWHKNGLVKHYTFTFQYNGMRKFCLTLMGTFLIISFATAQKVTYSEPDKEDGRGLNYEIIGRFAGNYLIYKNNRDVHSISVYNNQMKIAEKNTLDFLPDKILNADFLMYPDFFYLFYQYQRRSIIYSMAVKLDVKGKKLADPIQLDTTDVSFLASNKIYGVVFSENKQFIATYTINNKNDRSHIVKAVLFDKDLNKINKSIIPVDMPERNDMLVNFQLDNDGDLVFLKTSGNAQNDAISKIAIVSIQKNNGALAYYEVNMQKAFLDDISLKIDNFNKRYILSSFYSKQRRGNVEGVYSYVWDKQNQKPITNTLVMFDENLRVEAKGSNSLKAAFNDYFLRSIIAKQDGGYVLIAEAVYTSSRGGINNTRWDYLNGSPMWGGGFGNPGFYSWGNPWGSPFNNPWNRWGNGFNNITRYYADNILLLSFDSSAKVEWVNLIPKSQYDDNTDELIGYGMINTGSNIHFLFNVQEKRSNMLNDQYIDENGQVVRNPTLKNLDKGYDFMPKYAKQVGAKQIIVPCQYRNYVCFAKLDL